MIKTFLKKTFNIRDGEMTISFLMQLYVFLIITVLLIVKPTINALFINRLGADSLAFGFLFIAATAIGASYFYNKAVQIFSLKNIITNTLIFFSTSFFILSVLLQLGLVTKGLLYSYYVIYGIFGVLAASQFWLLANMVFNAREAKRLFGFIGAGAIAGGIFGGYLTNLLAPLIGNAYLLIIAACFILFCIPLLFNIYKKGNVSKIKSQSSTKKDYNEQPAWKILISNRHLTYLALIVGIGVIVAKLVDFQFSDFASRAIPDSNDLASFFGFWFSTFNLISLCIQLFLTNRVVEWLGVNSSLLLLPLGIALGSLLFLTFPELWVLIIIKGIDGSFKQSVNKAATELVMVPISLEVKNKTKSFIDVVVDSVATGIAGCLLIFVIKGLDLPSTYITIIILLLIFVWLVGIFKVRESYFKSFRESLKAAVTSPDHKSLKRRKTNIKMGRSVLTSGTTDEILLYLENLTSTNAKILKPKVLNLLQHPDNAVKVGAINQLYHYPRGTAVDKVRELVYTKDDEVVLAAMNYLIVHTHLSDDRIFDSYLNHSSDYIAHAALLCLAKEASHNKKIAARYNLELRIELWLAELELPDSDHRVEELGFLLETIGYAQIPKFYSFISANFNNKDSLIVSHAIRAAGISKYESFILQLLDFLAIKEHRHGTITALASYGESIISYLLKLETQKKLPSNVKKHVPKVVQKFKTQVSIKVLLKFLESRDITIRLAAAKSLNALKSNAFQLNFYPKTIYKLLISYAQEFKEVTEAKEVIDKYEERENYLALENDEKIEISLARGVLLDTLTTQLMQRLQTLFLLLGVYYDKKDLDIAYRGIISKEEDTIANAVEFLDNILSPKLKMYLLPILETTTLNDEQDTQPLGRKSFNNTLIYLLDEGDAKVRLPVIYFIQYLGDTSFLPSLRALQSTAKNKEVVSFISLAIQKLQPELLRDLS